MVKKNEELRMRITMQDSLQEQTVSEIILFYKIRNKTSAETYPFSSFIALLWAWFDAFLYEDMWSMNRPAIFAKLYMMDYLGKLCKKAIKNTEL